jgi:hypothetical protein
MKPTWFPAETQWVCNSPESGPGADNGPVPNGAPARVSPPLERAFPWKTPTFQRTRTASLPAPWIG